MIEENLNLIGQEVKIISPKIRLHWDMKRTIVRTSSKCMVECLFAITLFSSSCIVPQMTKVNYFMRRVSICPDRYSEARCNTPLGSNWLATSRLTANKKGSDSRMQRTPEVDRFAGIVNLQCDFRTFYNFS